MDREQDKCEHDKIFSNLVLTSMPPQYPWVCRKCGKQGIDRGIMMPPHDEYYETIKKFKEVKDEQ